MTVLEVLVRKRNAAITRASLLSSATSRFARDGYENVSLREIAADVGVDVSLVSRYFGGKEELFSEVLASTPPPDDFFVGDPRNFGERMSRKLVIEPQDNKSLDCLLIMMRSSSSPKASEAIRKSSEERFYGPFAAWLGGPDAMIRARIASDIMKGVAIDRIISDDFGLDAEQREKFRARIARLLQAAVDV